MEKIWKFIKDEDGLELTEYAVMGGIIVVLTVVTIGLLKDQIIIAFEAIIDAITPAGE